MTIEELIELTNRINTLNDIYEIVKSNDKLTINIKDALDTDLKTFDIERDEYKERIIKEIDDIAVPLINQFHNINSYLNNKYHFDAAFLINIYADCQSNDKFLNTLKDNYLNSGEVLTLYSRGPVDGIEQTYGFYLLRKNENQVDELNKFMGNINEDNRKYISEIMEDITINVLGTVNDAGDYLDLPDNENDFPYDINESDEDMIIE